MSPLRTLWLPAPIGCFHFTVPVARSTAHSDKASPSFGPSATLRNTRLPDTIGVEPDTAGSGSFQVTFSVADQFSGSLRSALMPFWPGPRHIGQASARMASPARTERTDAAATGRNRPWFMTEFSGYPTY